MLCSGIMVENVAGKLLAEERHVERRSFSIEPTLYVFKVIGTTGLVS